MYKMCHYEAAMDRIGEDIPWIEDEQNLPVRTYGGLTRKCHNHDEIAREMTSNNSQCDVKTIVSVTSKPIALLLKLLCCEGKAKEVREVSQTFDSKKWFKMAAPIVVIDSTPLFT